MEDRNDSVLNRGCNAIGVAFDEAPQELLEAFNKASLIISKGMANYENLTEGIWLHCLSAADKM
ncbi:ARMT1-like domain-containing protein [Methanohalophilus euhalobius]|uniref:Uncharacterized protein DUF89 n=1 Tax=Methanohalophilus euhalobius TaxID=51203 RepID=A0A314ZXU2_9EURY|nr:ARMT1-like domain-containing protein [Methanohalophilus euhalobius]PQV43443.1 uncharacterized protein DUF89 [Methanohalophilus euhalobius]